MKRLAFITNIILFSLTFAQNTSYKFDYYDISNGLSQNRAQAIFQANDGYIYVGSQGGLDRFDGYDFKYYSHNPVDTTSIPYGWVNAIGQDNFGNIWVGTQQKTVGYLQPDGRWKRVSLKGMIEFNKNIGAWWWGLITDFDFIEGKTLISSYGNGLFIIEEGKEKHFTSDNNDINIISEIYTVDNQIFLATSAGVYKFDETKEEFIQTSISSPAFGFSAGNNDDEFYVSSPSSVYNYNINNNESLEVELDISKKDRDFKRMAFHNQKLWIVNESYGIVIYDTKTNSSFEIKPPSIKDTEHAKMIVDRDNAIWIGTASYGMMKYDPGKQKFKLYSKSFPPSNSLGFDVGWSATIDNQGNYWTGKAEAFSELVKIDRKTGKVKRYLQDSEDARSWFWAIVNTKEGLLVRKAYPGRGGAQWFNYNSKNDKFNKTSFTALFPDTVGGTWGYTSDKRTFALSSKGIKIYNGKFFELDEKLNANFVDKKFPQTDYSVQGDVVYMREPSKEAIDQIIISYEELDKQRKYAQSLMTKYDKERLPNAQKGFDTYIKEVKKAANYAVKEFEMRKAAFQWQRAQTAKSGSLDVNKVHSYKYNEDIFARVTNLANAKNHGMIMMIDYSGSMSTTLASVIDQLIHLVTFCKLVNIPFDVYAFTTGNDYETQAKLARDGDIDFSNVSMPLLISSKLKKAQFKEALMALYMRRQCLSSDRWQTNEFGDYFTEMPYDSSICARAEEWGSTPLNHCLVLAHGLVRKFKARHNVDKMNLIVLSDGDSNGMHAFRDRERTDRTDVKRYGTSTVYVDGKNLKMENLGRYATAELLNNIRKRYGCNILGFFISTDAYEFRNKLRMMDEYDTAPANKEYRKNKCVRRVNSLGYDEFYLVKGGKQLKTNIEDFDVDEEASTAQVRNAFKKFSKSKKKNKVLLTNFGKAVA